MTARKIRMTAVGLVAMPADRDERTVTADDFVRDATLMPAFSELYMLEVQIAERGWSLAQWEAAEAVDGAWSRALDAANNNDAEGMRAALARARDAAAAAGYSTEHEDAALAMLPPQKARAA